VTIRATALGVAMVVAVAASSAAQTTGTAPSLGEIARQAEAAKATVKKAKKTYTNADLSAIPSDTPPAAAAPPSTGFVSKTLDKPLTAEEIITRSEEKVDQDNLKKESEPHWRKRAEMIRSEMARVEARLVSLSRPSEARDKNPAAAARHAAEVSKYQQGRDALKQDWAKLEEAARVAKIPHDWLNPRPPL
jgi:hypothetical protein